MRLRALALALATGAAALGGVAAAGEPTTVYFQMEGACNTTPPRVLMLEQVEEFSGPCFPVAAGTAGQAGGAEETYNSVKAVTGLKLVKGQAVAGQFRFMNFFEGGAGVPGPSLGVMDFSVTITAKIGGKEVTLVEFSESLSPVAGTEKVFEFTGEVPEGGAVRSMTANVSASGNTVLAMGFDHANSFFTIG